MRTLLRFCIAFSAACSTACGGDDDTSGAAPASVGINVDDRRQPISGFGASSAWTAPSMSEELADQLFSAELGIGLSFLRVRIAPNGTTGELATAQQAIARGARVWAAPWSPPGAWKEGSNPQNALWGGHLLPEFYPDWADSLASFVEDAAAQGVPLYGLSVQNEPGYVNQWETCEWTPATLATFTRDHLIPALRARGLETPLIAPESNSWGRLAEFAEPLLEDPTTREAVKFVATHAYGGSPFKYGTAVEHGKELWQTEVSESISDGPDAGITSGLWVARMMHDALTIADASAWHYWWLLPRTDVQTGNSALLLDGVVTRRAHVMGNFSKFVRPGSVRVDTSSINPQRGVFVSAYRDDAAGRLVIVAMNFSTSPLKQRFEVTGATPGEVVPWVTSEALALEAQPSLPAENPFEYELPAQSVTSLVTALD